MRALTGRPEHVNDTIPECRNRGSAEFSAGSAPPAPLVRRQHRYIPLILRSHQGQPGGLVGSDRVRRRISSSRGRVRARRAARLLDGSA